MQQLFSKEEQETKSMEDLFERFNLLPRPVNHELENVHSIGEDALSKVFEKLPREGNLRIPYFYVF